jgi:hypothetical protein
MAIASLTMHRQAKTPQNAKHVADRTTAQKLLANIALQAQNYLEGNTGNVNTLVDKTTHKCAQASGLGN